MTTDSEPFRFEQIHIDAARNATDDFNLFHDPLRWQRLAGNPFGGPIVLGFQLVCLAEGWLRGQGIITDDGPAFVNGQYQFASALRPGESARIEAGRPRIEADRRSCRLLVRGPSGLILRGQIQQEPEARHVPEDAPAIAPDVLARQPDRSWFGNSRWFLKHKYMNTGNAKNFLCGSRVEQTRFIDELEDRVRFPDSFPAALISCALLERARSEGHDFEREPMVYTQHRISIDQRRMARLKSNDRVSLLVGPPREQTAGRGLGAQAVRQQTHGCLVLDRQGQPLVQALISLSPLSALREGDA